MTSRTIHPKLDNAPVVLVLAQIRFSPVLKMREYITDIQDELRKNGFPRFEEEKIVLLGHGSQPAVGGRWIFTNSNGTESVVLTESFVVLETNDYDIFSSFIDKFKGVIEILRTKVEIGETDRIGLRYINLLRPKGAGNSIDFLEDDLRGLSKSQFPGVEGIINTQVSRGQTRFGNMVVRVIQSSDGSRLPADLAESKLEFSFDVARGELVTFLDIDHYGSIKKAFNMNELQPVLDAMHETIEDVFIASVTKEAYASWS